MIANDHELQLYIRFRLNDNDGLHCPNDVFIFKRNLFIHRKYVMELKLVPWHYEQPFVITRSSFFFWFFASSKIDESEISMIFNFFPPYYQVLAILQQAYCSWMYRASRSYSGTLLQLLQAVIWSLKSWVSSLKVTGVGQRSSMRCFLPLLLWIILMCPLKDLMDQLQLIS